MSCLITMSQKELHRLEVIQKIRDEHQRGFGRGETVYDPWHYVPALARKPGALRNGAPFRNGFCQPRWRRSASD